MKVIAKINNSKYICEIEHIELEKFLNLYYGNKAELDVGEEINLGEGYDFLEDMKDAITKINSFNDASQKIANIVARGLLLSIKSEEQA